MITKSFTKIVLAWMLAITAVFGVAAECGGEEGTYQGGDDGLPHWRR